MKRSFLPLRTYLGVCLAVFGLSNAAFAHQHTHKSATSPAVPTEAASKASVTKTTNFGRCEITILNYTYESFDVYGRFDDGSALESFRIYPKDEPHYINLYYYGYCHAGMDLSIYDTQGRLLHGRYTYAGEVLKVKYSNNNQLQIERS
ncbi:MAG: hypothetical protein H2069_05640 [Legionella sp.]|nr:hypothetical protein [Legionella sp.]